MAALKNTVDGVAHISHNHGLAACMYRRLVLLSLTKRMWHELCDTKKMIEREPPTIILGFSCDDDQFNEPECSALSQVPVVKSMRCFFGWWPNRGIDWPSCLSISRAAKLSNRPPQIAHKHIYDETWVSKNVTLRQVDGRRSVSWDAQMLALPTRLKSNILYALRSLGCVVPRLFLEPRSHWTRLDKLYRHWEHGQKSNGSGRVPARSFQGITWLARRK